VAHAYNPSYSEVEIRKIETSLGKQFMKTHLQNNQSKMELEVWLK
jgi:hypothetical protein